MKKFFLLLSFVFMNGLVLNKSFAEGSSSPGQGLKVKDYKNAQMNSSSSSSSSSSQGITPEQQKKLEEALEKGKKYLEERNKYLKELENE